MPIIPQSRGNPQASDIAIETALPMTGTVSREDAQSGLTKNDAEVAKLFEDRNIQLTQGGSIQYDISGTFLTLSENLNLEINSQVAGGTPTIIPLLPGSAPYTINVSVSGHFGYVVIDRILGTATYFDDQTTLPSVNASNQEVFIVGKRDDSGDGFKRFYFRDGTAITAGQSIRLGAPSGFILQFFTSSQVTTDSSAISASIYTTFDNSPAFTFTPTVSGIYSVTASVPLSESGTTGKTGNAIIICSSGGATLLSQTAGIVYSNTSNNEGRSSAYLITVFNLTAGTSYTFDIQGATNGGGTITLIGNEAPFNMYAALVG